MNTKGFLAALLSAAICTASISTASVSATEVKFDIPVCLTQSLHSSVEYKTGTYITNDYVNYRQGYSIDFPKYGIIPKGTTVEVTEIFNGWGKINYNGKIAWFNLEYADYVQPVTQTTTTTAITTPASTEKLGIYITTGDVYYRKGHKTECEAYGVIPKGTKVEVLEIYQGWGRTNYEGKDSWFYLKFADFYSESKITNPVTSSTTAATTTTTTVTTAATTVSTTVTTEETPTILPLDLNYSEGDVDGNGIVDASDASTILLYYVKLQTGGVSWFNEKQILFADVNSDKKIDASDASLVLAYYCYTSTNKEFLKMKEWVSGELVPPVETTTQPITTTTTQNIFTTTASDYTQTSTETQSTTSSVETTTTTASETTSTTLTETTTTSSETTTTTTDTTSTTTITSSETTTTSETSTSTTVTTVVTTPPVTTTTYQYPLAAKRLDEVGWKIENAFNAAAGITYYGQKPDMPQDDVTTMEWYAEFGFKNGKGNCYVMAAMFCEMAKTLGYEAHMISGKVPLRSGGYGPHSWVELTVDGKVYVCDPDFANETKRNGFMIEYGQSGTWKYTIEKRMS